MGARKNGSLEDGKKEANNTRKKGEARHAGSELRFGYKGLGRRARDYRSSGTIGRIEEERRKSAKAIKRKVPKATKTEGVTRYGKR